MDDQASPQPMIMEDHGLLRIRRSHLYSLLLPMAFAAGLALGYLFWGRSPSQPVGAVTQAAGTQDQAQPARLEIEDGGSPSLGPNDAPIVIVEFSDYNCPYCQVWHIETFGPLMDAYPGKIRFVYRDYPITSQESFVAAQAAHCAGEQDAFWAFHDALFSGGRGLGRSAYQAYAQALGLDATALMTCLDSEEYAEQVQADARYAAGLGISGTPTFFINGIPLVGAQPIARFTQVIEAELGGG
jgi:protein-disulfide isomerase